VPLASLDDINVHLPEDKIQVLDADDNALQIDAERIIKARLSGTYSPLTLAGWTTPASEAGSLTPPIISELSGKLIAAVKYARKFSSESTGLPEYAQWLYDQVMDTLDGIVLGTITLPVDEVVDTGAHLSRDMFWPNDDTSTVGRFKRSDVF
jgi:hypothetical protein